jgi:hypothetical protein
MAQTEQRGKSDRKQQRASQYGFDHRLLSLEERCCYARLPRSTLSRAPSSWLWSFREMDGPDGAAYGRPCSKAFLAPRSPTEGWCDEVSKQHGPSNSFTTRPPDLNIREGLEPDAACLLLRLGREQQWIAFASTSVRRIGCFGFRHIFCVDGDDTRAAPMSGHHHPQSLIFAHAKFRLQNRDDELAGREIVIEQDNFMQARPFDFYLILDLGLGDCVSHERDAFVGHGSSVSACETIASVNLPKQHTAFWSTSIRCRAPCSQVADLPHDNVLGCACQPAHDQALRPTEGADHAGTSGEDSAVVGVRPTNTATTGLSSLLSIQLRP